MHRMAVVLIALATAALPPAGCSGRRSNAPEPWAKPGNWVTLTEEEDPRPHAAVREALAEKSERQLAAATEEDTEFAEYYSPGEGGRPHSSPTTCAGLARRGLNGCSPRTCRYSVSKLLHTSTAAAGRAGGRDIVARGRVAFRDRETEGYILELEVQLVRQAEGPWRVRRVELRHICTVIR